MPLVIFCRPLWDSLEFHSLLALKPLGSHRKFIVIPNFLILQKPLLSDFGLIVFLVQILLIFLRIPN